MKKKSVQGIMENYIKLNQRKVQELRDNYWNIHQQLMLKNLNNKLYI